MSEKIQSTTHNMKLQPDPFKNIKSGKKTIELRLNDEKRQKISPGDTIVFSCKEEKLKTNVIALYHFSSFNELYETLPLEKCGYSNREINNASPDDMLKYYSKEAQEKYGVLGIELIITKG